MKQHPRAKHVGIPNRPIGDDLAKSVLPTPAHGKLSAYDLRDELQSPLGWTDDELHQLPVQYGSELALGDMCLDLDHPERGEFRATERATINPGCRYVAKRMVPEELWYRLITSIGVDDAPAGNKAATPGAFGEPNTEEIASSRGGEGATSVGEKGLEVEAGLRPRLGRHRS